MGYLGDKGLIKSVRRYWTSSVEVLCELVYAGRLRALDFSGWVEDCGGISLRYVFLCKCWSQSHGWTLTTEIGRRKLAFKVAGRSLKTKLLQAKEKGDLCCTSKKAFVQYFA